MREFGLFEENYEFKNHSPNVGLLRKKGLEVTPVFQSDSFLDNLKLFTCIVQI